MVEPIISEDAVKFLKNNKNIKEKVKAKILLCLDEFLFVATRRCNKHELEGEFKGYHRLHLGDDLVAVYRIGGERPNRYAIVLKIMSEKSYHNWIRY